MNQIAIVNCTSPTTGKLDQALFEDHWCLYDFTVRQGNFLLCYRIEKGHLN